MLGRLAVQPADHPQGVPERRRGLGSVARLALRLADHDHVDADDACLALLDEPDDGNTAPSSGNANCGDGPSAVARNVLTHVVTLSCPMRCTSDRHRG